MEPEPQAKLPLKRALALQHLEIAARYLYTNFHPLPVLIVLFAAVLHTWQPMASLLWWAAIACAGWLLAMRTMRAFLRDENRGPHLRRWTILISLAIAAAATPLASVAPLFWVDGARLNNVLLYVVLAAAIASSGAQAAPSMPALLSNLVPYVAAFFYTSLAHEAWPMSAALALLQIGFVALVSLYARAGWLMTHEMLLLREEKRGLVKRLEKALNQATDERARAIDASRAKSEFLANMSHELRTPLNAILGFSEMLHRDSFAMKRAEYARLIHDSGRHLLELINDILDLSKIESGKLVLRDDTVDLGAIALECAELLALKAREGGIAVSVDAASSLPYVMADARALKQMMLNLASNAAKFTPPGGKIVIFARQTAQSEIAFGVSDSGVGIAEEDQARVFENFGQGRHDAISTDKGTGLGLPIVKGLAEAHGGRVLLESRINEGTTVTVFLPAERALGESGLRAAG